MSETQGANLVGSIERCHCNRSLSAMIGLLFIFYKYKIYDGTYKKLVVTCDGLIPILGKRIGCRMSILIPWNDDPDLCRQVKCAIAIYFKYCRKRHGKIVLFLSERRLHTRSRGDGDLSPPLSWVGALTSQSISTGGNILTKAVVYLPTLSCISLWVNYCNIILKSYISWFMNFPLWFKMPAVILLKIHFY